MQSRPIVSFGLPCAHHTPISNATTIGVCYVPPETTLASQPDGRPAQLRFQALTERLLVATAQGHAVLAGDFNARVGSLPDPWVADMGDSIPPQVQNADSTVNAHGRKLVRLCADSAMILCTGRTLADTPAQPTFKARTNTVASRLDHVLVDPDLFSSIQYCGVGLTRPDSDHMPLEMRILLSAAAPPSPPLPPVQQHTPTWLWDGAKREQYALALQAGSCQASLQQSCGAAAAGDLQQADVHFNTALKTAAQMAGLRQTRPQSSQPPRLSDFPWFKFKVCCAQISVAACQVAVSSQSRGQTSTASLSGAAQAQQGSRQSAGYPVFVPAAQEQSSPVLAQGQLATQHAPPQSYRHPQPGMGTWPI